MYTCVLRVGNSDIKLVLLLPNVYPTTLRKKMAFCAKAAEGTWPKTLSHFKEIEIPDGNISTRDLNTADLNQKEDKPSEARNKRKPTCEAFVSRLYS